MGYIAMKAFALIFLVALCGCSDEDGARRVLSAQGLTEIQTSGWSFFGCGEDDRFATNFTAKQNGSRVSGVVCSGFFKGSTVRFK